MGPVKVVLTDFERTLVRLFEDRRVEQEFFDEVWDLCARRGVPTRVRKAAGESPYSLWMQAHRWMTAPWSKQLLRRKKHRDRRAKVTYHLDPLHAEITYHLVSKIAIKYEMDAAESIELFEDVEPVLERWKSAGITVVVVSNNATKAVERVLENNDAEHLVDLVVGREYQHEMVGNLKPKPLLLKKALEISKCSADTALLVGDSVDDMRAGQAAKIGFSVGLLQHSTASEQQLRDAGARLVLSRFGDLLTNDEVQRRLHGGDPSPVR